ncbi:hypothetical protein [Methylobacterium sp. A54F]
MSNILRPDFGSRVRPPMPEAPEEGHSLLRVFGDAAGHIVALIRDEAGPEGPALKVVVGVLAGREVEAVAVFPETPAGEVDAQVTGLAVVRALEVVEGRDGAGMA